MHTPDLSLKLGQGSTSEVVELLRAAREPLCINGCAGCYDAFLLCSLFTAQNRTLLVFVPDNKQAETLARECACLLPDDSVSVFPSRDAIPYNMRSPFGATVEKRFSVLSQLMNGNKRIYITTPATMLQKILPQKDLFKHIIKLHTNDEISQETLAAWLTENGFSRQTLAENIGSFSLRGSILDIYPFITENPVRIEFWGDTIESIREFDVFKQTSLKNHSSIDIFPMKEFCFKDAHIDQAFERIEDFCNSSTIDTLHVHKLKHQWKSQLDHDGIEWFLHWFNFGSSSLLDFLPSDCMIFWNDIFPPTRRLEECFENYHRHLKQVPESLIPFVSKPDDLLFPIESSLPAFLKFDRCYINTGSIEEPCSALNLTLHEQPAFSSNVPLLLSDIRTKESQGYSITLVSESEGHAERLAAHLDSSIVATTINIGFIEHGFIDPVHKIAIYSESQIFNRTHRVPSQKKFKKNVHISSYDSLLPGDFVVHIDHGISRFTGIERIKTNETQQDCMVLEYLDKAKVYIPIEDFHKVQKYIGKDSAAPPLSKLGTARWEKQKEKTRESLKEMAEHLIAIYAKRECLDGIAFSDDTIWQKEFEDSFIYEPTPDQLSAIIDVKKDMESSKPMDRLVCGDVGFGKTEIAMRAAAKAALDGYQVAVLAPTTILAAQHFATFKERMADLPISIGVLSRFLTSQEQNAVLNKLQNGDLDIIIGTHRLLSKDVSFKNLGLLVIDEEQRFGVKHKERLKEYRYKVDVLSMTATPIPRSLHMSLIGIRDLSIINTPPRNRLPIETHVLEYHDEILKTAIENELERGGQVYVVHNRISHLQELQDRIEMNVNRARVVVAHGQMDEKQLERVMKEFTAGKYDVLLSTSIIENGLDIPNVNTIIVTKADILGLSQLYQLRGRVGRSSEQAYAYFLTPPFKTINEISLKRLRALEQYTDLGSGFQIAMRDLEIRGAGNILGVEQHGSIAAVGFDLYCCLLKEEIDKILGTTPPPQDREIKMDIPISAYISAEYVPDSTLRVSLYQQCSACKELTEIKEIESDLLDRFGPLPEPTHALLLLLQIKVLAQQAGFSHVSFSNKTLTLSFHGSDDTIAEKIKAFISDSKNQFDVVYGAPILLKTVLSSSNIFQNIQEIIGILQHPNKKL